MKGQVLHCVRAHLKVLGWSLVWNEHEGTQEVKTGSIAFVPVVSDGASSCHRKCWSAVISSSETSG